MPRSALARLLCVALPLVCLGCGVGPVKETAFSYGAMDTSGGTVEAGDVTLVIPPDALSEPTTIAILPEVNPLPIVVAPGDPCSYSLLGPQWCCGPLGLGLNRDGTCVVEYDETLLPPGVMESDLVLLLWDDALKALVRDPNASQDPDADTFTADPYRTLGHLAVGIRTCPPLGILITGVNPNAPPPLVGPGGTAQEEPLQSGMYLASIDGSVLPTRVPTGEEFPQAFVPSPDDERVLYLRFFLDPDLQVIVRQRFTVTLDGADPVLVAGDDELINGPDPSYGWLRNEDTVFFQERLLGDDAPATHRIATVPGAGGEQPTELYDLGESIFTDDARQSPDGAHMLVRYISGLGTEVIDVFEVATGDAVSQGLIPLGGGQATPRFLPDSTGIYLINDARDAVYRYSLDGTSFSTLFSLPPTQGALKDFVIAPNGDDYAYVAQFASNDDILFVGSFSGGARAQTDLAQDATYQEMLVHPNGQSVLFDATISNVRIFAMDDATEGPALPALDTSLLDINEATGQLLIVVPRARPPGITEIDPPEQTAPVGVYLADADGANLTPIDTPEELEIEQARWLRTIRRAPGMPFEIRIR